MKSPSRRQRKPSSGSKTAAEIVTKPSGTGEMRLQRFLALCGCGSRRQCEELITDGRISVNGQVVTVLGTKIHHQNQQVTLDGRPVRFEKKIYFLLNKPPGYLCTSADPEGRPRAIDLIPASRERLFTVGRLDESSQGLVVITNDGLLANRLAHPRYEVPKIYRVLVAGYPTPEAMQSLRQGHDFHEGTFKVESVRDIKTVGQSTLLEVVLKEGKNREIRRLLARIGHKVMRLERIALGPLKLGRLRLGECRPLTPAEVRQLKSGRTGESEEASKTKSTPSAKRGSRPPRRRTSRRKDSRS